MAIIQLPNGETLEVPDNWDEKQVQSAVDSIPETFTTEELKKAKVGPSYDIFEHALRPIEAAFSIPAALYHAFWEASRQFGGVERPPGTSRIESELMGLKETGEQAWKTLKAPYRPLGVPGPELTTPSKIAGVEGLAGLPMDIALDPFLGVFAPSIAAKIARRGIPEHVGKQIMPKKFPTMSELYPPEPTIIPPEVPSPPTWRMGQNLPMIIEGQKPLPKPLFEFDVSLARKKIGPETLMGKNLAEGKIGKPLNIEVGVGQEANEKIFRLVDKGGKVYAELGLKGNEPAKTLEVSWLNIDAGGIKPEIIRTHRTGMEVKPIKGLYKHIHSNLELYAKENNYNIIGVSPTAGGGDRLRYMGYLDVPIGEVPYTMFKRVGQRIDFVPDFNQRVKNLKISQEIGFLNAQKASEINDMAARRSMFFDVSKDKEYVFFNRIGEEITRFSDKVIEPTTVYRATYEPFNKTLIADKGVYITPDQGVANRYKTPGRILEKLYLKNDSKILLYEDIPKKMLSDRNFDINIVKYAKENGYDAVSATPTVKPGILQNKILVVNPDKLSKTPIPQYIRAVDEAESFVKGIKITPSDYWITQQSQFKRAEALYAKTVQQTAAKNIDEAMKYPKTFEKEVIAPTYRKFVKPEIPGVIKPQVVPTAIKVDEAISSINSVFDTGTGEIVALGNKVIPIRESLFSVLKSIMEVPNDFYERIVTIKGWLKTPQQFFEQQPNKMVKEVFYRRVKYAEKNMTVELNNSKTEINKLRESFNLNNKNFNRIGIHAIAQDENGLRTLQVMKKEIPILTENETQFYNFIRTKYEEFFNRINQAREFVGIKPIDYRGDYFTFFRNYDELEKLGYHITDGSLAEHINKFVHKSSTVFMHEKVRKGGIIPLETNAFDVFSRYATRSIEHIHMTPAVGINRALLKDMVVDSKNFSIKDNAPRFYVWMNKWLDDIAGQRATTELPHFLERTLNTLNRNMVGGMLSGNVRSDIIQPTALAQSFTELGPKYLMKGFRDYFKDPKMLGAIKESLVLSGREFDISVAEAYKMVKEPGLFTKFIEAMSGEIFPSMRKTSRVYRGGKQAVTKMGMKPLTFLDIQSAKITYAGAKRKAIEYEKLVGDAARNYADDIVIKTQASGKISDLSAAQRTPLGKTLFLLQTFVISNWNWLTKNVLGVSNPNMKNIERFEKIMKFIIGVSFVNVLFEDVLGTYSPFPTPIKAFLKERERGGSIPKAMLRSAREMTELIPGPGGAIRYGSHPGGPLMEVIGAGGRKLAGRIEYKKPLEIMAMLWGIPGTSQIKKLYTGEKYGAGIIESILGMVEPPSKRPVRKKRLRKE